MYPLDAAAPWPCNQWYMAGFSAEVGCSLIARTFLNTRVVMFRDDAGRAHALSGICPHRMMPMELGSIENGRLVCGYHGLAFDAAGACVAAPTSSSTPTCSLECFPLKEVGPLLWIWLGDPSLADETSLPAQAAIGIGRDGWLTQCVDHYELDARYMLLIDNLFDLSHLGFVHASIVGSGGISLVPQRIEERDGRLLSVRVMRDVPSDDYHHFLYPGIGPRMTTTLESELLGISLINAGSEVFEGAGTDARRLGQTNFIHGVTPATEHKTHYWIMMTRDYRQTDEALSAALAAQNVAVVAQDRAALASIEALLQGNGHLPREVSMKSDAAALRARLKIIQMIRNDDRALGAAA